MNLEPLLKPFQEKCHRCHKICSIKDIGEVVAHNSYDGNSGKYRICYGCECDLKRFMNNFAYNKCHFCDKELIDEHYEYELELKGRPYGETGSTYYMCEKCFYVFEEGGCNQCDSL